MNLGIEEHRGFCYESTDRYGHAVWPQPVITRAKVAYVSEGPLVAARSSEDVTEHSVFREDSYDPVSRIRRGRVYEAQGQQPQDWRVQPHPARPLDAARFDGGVIKRAYTFASVPMWQRYFTGRSERPVLLLGVDDRFTVWTIINVEAISTGEDLLTLKARSSFGILPELDEGKVPAASLASVKECLDTFVDEVHRSAPISVIDRAREVAAEVLQACYGLTGSAARDLGDLAKKLEADKKFVAANSARIINRLHVRGKPAERRKRPMPSIREQDAELATHCVGTILRELGWAEWP